MTSERVMHLGFTGTKAGMSKAQRTKVLWLLKEFEPEYVHHGDCVGADAEMHDLAKLVGASRWIHPPTDKKYWANVERETGDVISDDRPYLDRNHDIVDQCSILIATPVSDIELVRSGTWATVRYAKDRPKHRPRIIVVYQDGSHQDV